MAITSREFERVRTRSAKTRRAGYAVAATYDRKQDLIVVELDSGLQISFPPRLAEGLAEASATALTAIEITPSGLGLHWPKLDADLYVPELLQGVFGSKKWMAAQLGAEGGKARSKAKALAAQKNGRKGGRPREDKAA